MNRPTWHWCPKGCGKKLVCVHNHNEGDRFQCIKCGTTVKDLATVRALWRAPEVVI